MLSPLFVHPGIMQGTRKSRVSLSLSLILPYRPRGVVKSGGPSDSYGFCLLNNISIGAGYALNVYRDDIKKVAIVDFGKY
jgi:hypothetical protein